METPAFVVPYPQPARLQGLDGRSFSATRGLRSPGVRPGGLRVAQGRSGSEAEGAADPRRQRGLPPGRGPREAGRRPDGGPDTALIRPCDADTQGRMSTLLVIAGPPGAGKSTVSAIVSSRLSPSVLIRGDTFFRFLDQGAQEPWRPEAKDQNHTVIRASGAAADSSPGEDTRPSSTESWGHGSCRPSSKPQDCTTCTTPPCCPRWSAACKGSPPGRQP